MLANRDYLAGDRFTVADIAGMAGFTFANVVNLDIADRRLRLWDWRTHA